MLQARRRGAVERSPWRAPVLLLVVLLHGVFTAATWYEMRARPPSPVSPARVGAVLQVRLIPPAVASPPTVPPVAPTPPVAGPVASRPAPAAPPRRAVPEGTVPAAPALRLYDRTGQLRPPPPAAATPRPGYVPQVPTDTAGVMTHRTPLPYRPTRFESAFPPADETALGAAARGVLRATRTGENRKVDLPGGIHLKCKTLLGIPTPDCAMPPAPPSKKDGDERLDMAPARPLVPQLAVPPYDLADCIARYRAGAPLPYGCPTDTPTQAVDAECDEARAAGTSPPPHCRRSATDSETH